MSFDDSSDDDVSSLQPIRGKRTRRGNQGEPISRRGIQEKIVQHTGEGIRCSFVQKNGVPCRVKTVDLHLWNDHGASLCQNHFNKKNVNTIKNSGKQQKEESSIEKRFDFMENIQSKSQQDDGDKPDMDLIKIAEETDTSTDQVFMSEHDRLVKAVKKSEEKRKIMEKIRKEGNEDKTDVRKIRKVVSSHSHEGEDEEEDEFERPEGISIKQEKIKVPSGYHAPDLAENDRERLQYIDANNIKWSKSIFLKLVKIASHLPLLDGLDRNLGREEAFQGTIDEAMANILNDTGLATIMRKFGAYWIFSTTIASTAGMTVWDNLKNNNKSESEIRNEVSPEVIQVAPLPPLRYNQEGERVVTGDPFFDSITPITV